MELLSIVRKLLFAIRLHGNIIYAARMTSIPWIKPRTGQKYTKNE